MPLGDQSTAWITVGFIRDTDKAILFDTDAGQVWIAKSQIGGRKSDEAGIHRIEIPAWLAKSENLADSKDGR